jgi:very-short-patch-repair endonuclease
MPGVVILRFDLPDSDVDVQECVPVTSGIRTILDCLRLLPFDDAARVLDRALQKQLVDFDGLCSRVIGLAGQRGTPKLIKLLKQAGLGTRSEAERRLYRLLRAANIGGWYANFRVSDVTGWIGEIDVAFPDVKLAIEVDGRAWHSAWDRFEWDRTKQNRLELAGWKVLRFTWEAITGRPAKVLADIQQMLAVLRARP